jgi:hypothetical protein
MQQRLWLILGTLLAALGLISAAFALNETAPTRPPISNERTPLSPANPYKQTAPDLPQPNTYIITLADAPLASYSGGQRLDMTSADGRSYRAHLTAVQNDLLRTLSAANGRSLTPLYQFTVALNGIVLK